VLKYSKKNAQKMPKGKKAPKIPKSTTTKKCQKLQGREVTKIHSKSKKVAKVQRSAKKNAKIRLAKSTKRCL